MKRWQKPNRPSKAQRCYAIQQLVTEYQEHGGAVNTSTTPSVDYTYADGSANTIRPTSLNYPNGRVISFTYASGDDDALSRITTLYDVAGGTTLVEYTYLGLGKFVESEYPQPDLTWTLVGGSDASNPYAGLDGFGRVIDCLWQGASGAVEEIQYGYDWNSNGLWRHNTVAPDGGNDELYAYDQLQRLIDMSRGDLTSGDASINSVTFAQSWRLDDFRLAPATTRAAPDAYVSKLICSRSRQRNHREKR